MKKYFLQSFILILLGFIGCNQNNNSNKKALQSWNEGKSKSEIIDFVNKITDEQSKDFIKPSNRVAVFDNDGTIWSEKPIYFQFYFAIDRVKELAPKHPEWKKKEPFKSILKNDEQAILKHGLDGVLDVLYATHTGTTVSEFHQIVAKWIQTAKHPVKNVPYTNLVFKPMLELLDYLREHEFKVYIVSGGSVEFMRPIISEIYNIPYEQIIGTSFKTEYDYNNGNPVIKRLSDVDFNNDKGGKPVNIQKIIGKKPIFCAGNSDGDLAMMQWTASNSKSSFNIYIHHTDAEREWAYDRNSHVGKLDKGLDAAKEKGWILVDMKNDWKIIYTFEAK
ncbi:MAG: HAD family hydrolase [Bacteroidota bacterium]